MWNTSFGRPASTAIIAISFSIQDVKNILIKNVLVANAAQLALSTLYLLFNGMITEISVNEEWSHFGVWHDWQAIENHTAKLRDKSPKRLLAKRWIKDKFLALMELSHLSAKRQEPMRPPVAEFKPDYKLLRVSAPQRMQRSSYFLSLPLRFGVPLQATLVALHWLISQSVFLTQADAYATDGSRVAVLDSSKIGYSMSAILATLAVCAGFLVVLAGFSLRRIAFDGPVVGTCSAAISAVCHRSACDREAPWMPLKFGERRTGGDVGAADPSSAVGHCSLTTYSRLQAPVEGKLYR